MNIKIQDYIKARLAAGATLAEAEKSAIHAFGTTQTAEVKSVIAWMVKQQ